MFLKYGFAVKEIRGKEGPINRNKALTFEFPILANIGREGGERS